MFKLIFLSILLIFSSFSFLITHPISLAMLLMFLCFILSSMILLIMYSWFFFILMLVFLGGVMIIITYMTSLAANEKFFFTMNNSPYLIIGLMLGLLYTFSQETMFSGKLNSSFSFTSILFENEFFFALIFCFFSLLMTLFSVVKIMKLESGPLVKRL